MSANRPVTEIHTQINQQEVPPAAGHGFYEWHERTNFPNNNGVTTDWTITPWHDVIGDLGGRSLRQYDFNIPRGNREDEAYWQESVFLYYYISALPPEGFTLELGLSGWIAGLQGDGGDLAANPDAAIVFTGFPYYEYANEHWPQNPPERAMALVGENPVTEPELGRIRLDSLTWINEFATNYEPFVITFPSSVVDLLEVGQQLGVRAWIDPAPRDLVPVVFFDDATGTNTFADLGFSFSPANQPEFFPTLTLTMTCPEPEEPVPFPPVAVGTPAGMPRDRLPAESIRRLAPTLADPRIHIPARLKRHSRRRVKR